MISRKTVALSFACALTGSSAVIAGFNAFSTAFEPQDDYVRFHQVKVPSALPGGDSYIISGGAYCAPKRDPKDCLDEVVRSISATLNAHANAKFTDVIPNIVSRSETGGNVRSFTQLKAMVHEAQEKGVRPDAIPTHYTLDAVYQGKGYIYPPSSVSRARCPNALGGGCPSGREF